MAVIAPARMWGGEGGGLRTTYFPRSWGGGRGPRAWVLSKFLCHRQGN
jgi:hypothetical protein